MNERPSTTKVGNPSCVIAWRTNCCFRMSQAEWLFNRAMYTYFTAWPACQVGLTHLGISGEGLALVSDSRHSLPEQLTHKSLLRLFDFTVSNMVVNDFHPLVKVSRCVAPYREKCVTNQRWMWSLDSYAIWLMSAYLYFTSINWNNIRVQNYMYDASSIRACE